MTALKEIAFQTGQSGSKPLLGAGCAMEVVSDRKCKGLVVPDLTYLTETIAMLDDLDNAVLRATWQRAWKRSAPKAARRRFLMLGIAWKWQAEQLGGFRSELARRLAALEARSGDCLSGPDHSASDLTAAARSGPGTRLVRDWRGERYEVHVTEKGYLWRGKGYGSLSAVATAITGISRNGPKFFGLRNGQGGR
jgi:hypothetical protein